MSGVLLVLMLFVALGVVGRGVLGEAMRSAHDAMISYILQDAVVLTVALAVHLQARRQVEPDTHNPLVATVAAGVILPLMDYTRSNDPLALAVNLTSRADARVAAPNARAGLLAATTFRLRPSTTRRPATHVLHRRLRLRALSRHRTWV
ncbi:MAG: hypothetical protein WKH64_11195 [Chloroflexia bacterium]